MKQEWARHLARGKGMKIHIFSMKKLLAKQQLGSYTRQWEGSIKLDVETQTVKM
jgi:hypothetical protein